MHEPLFPPRDDINRRVEIAKQLRSDFLHLTVRGAKHKLTAQTRIIQTLGASGAVLALVAGVFWLGIATPKVTEAGQPEISKEESSSLP